MKKPGVCESVQYGTCLILTICIYRVELTGVVGYYSLMESFKLSEKIGIERKRNMPMNSKRCVWTDSYSTHG